MRHAGYGGWSSSDACADDISERKLCTMVTKLQQLPIIQCIDDSILQSYQYVDRGCPLAGNEWVQINLADHRKIESESSQAMQSPYERKKSAGASTLATRGNLDS